jgi:hypothetical protein
VNRPIADFNPVGDIEAVDRLKVKILAESSERILVERREWHIRPQTDC